MLKFMDSSLKLLVKPSKWSLPCLLLPWTLPTLPKPPEIHQGWPLSKMLVLLLKKEVAPFEDNFLISLSSQTNLDWASLPKLKRRFGMLVQGNHISTLLTMKLMLLKTLRLIVILMIGSTRLLMEGSTTDVPNISFPSPSTRSNYHLLFY